MRHDRALRRHDQGEDSEVWPDAADTVILAHPAVDEYQGRVHLDGDARQRREIRLALKPGVRAPPGFIDELRGEIKRRTNVTLTVRIVPRQELPYFGYRARRWVDERAAGLAKFAAGSADTR